MFDNSVRLVGFVGKDAEVKTTKTQREFTVLSLATTASWKDKNGDGYIRRTEWHKLIAWGNLSTFAATLRKGIWAHRNKRLPNEIKRLPGYVAGWSPICSGMLLMQFLMQEMQRHVPSDLHNAETLRRKLVWVYPRLLCNRNL